MRDGIYKTLSLGRGWKSFLKSCERAKERGATAIAKAQAVIARDFYLEVSGAFVHGLLHIVHAENLLPGFRAIDPDLTSRDLGGNNSPLENAVLASAKRLESRGVRGRALVDRAFGESLEEHKRSRMNQIEQHYLKEAGSSARPAIEAARMALANVDSSNFVPSRLERKSQRLVSTKRDIDPDENLESVR